MLSQECVEISEAIPSDIAQIIDLHHQSFPIIYDLEFYKCLFRQDRICLVACQPDSNGGRKLCGVISACLNVDRGDAYIMTICVHKAYRRRGIAQDLLAGLLLIIQPRFNAARQVNLHVLKQNLEAIALYMKAGFDILKIDRGHYLINNCYHDAYLMQKRLP